MSASRQLVFGRYDRAVFLTYIAYAAGSLVVPVALVVLTRDLGFSLDAGGMTASGGLVLGRTLAVMASLLLCGFVAGRWGTRTTLGASVFLMSLGLLLCACAPGYSFLLLGLVTAGVGDGVIEGLTTPFIHDLHPHEPGRYINFSHAFWSVGVVASVLVGGALLTAGVSWRWLLAGTALLGSLAGGLLLGGPAAGPAAPGAVRQNPWRQTCTHAGRVFRQPRFWLYFAAMFLAGGGEYCLTFWTASHVQLRYGTAAWGGGLGTACFASGMVLGRMGWAVLLRQHHLKALVVCSAFGGAAVSLGLPVAGSLPPFFALLFFAGLATAPFWPSIQSHATTRLPHTDPTVLLILLSCAGIPGSGFFAFLMGLLGNRSGDLAHAFFLVPACFASLGLLIALDHLPPHAP